MPHINKSRNAPASETSGSAQGGAEDPDPVAREESLAAGAARCEGDDNVGDGDIVKSPSDPKQYR